MKNILITGGCGYIGSALHKHLHTKYNITSVDLEWFGKYIPYGNLKQDFNELDFDFLDRFDVIIHVAANSSVALCKDLMDTIDNNVTKFIHLVNKLYRQKFIYASSSCVYVTSDNTPKKETDSIVPMDGLTFTKTTIDQYMPLSNIEYYGLRFGSVAGWSPNTRLDLMVNSMTYSAIDNKVVNVFNGNAHRPILSINDLCRSITAIIESKKDNRGIYNLASNNYTIKDVGQQVADYMKVPLKDNGNNFTYDFSISSEKFSNTFDIELKDNIETIVDSLISNPKDVTWSKRERK